MRITVGRGNNTHTFHVNPDKVSRERAAEDLKNYLFRPNLLLKPRQQAALKKAA